MIKHLKFSCIAISILFSTLAMAQNPTISIQSTLKNISGTAVPDGDESILFKLYNQVEGGDDIWMEPATVEVVSGVYSHELGSVVPLVPGDFGVQLYLGVTTNNKELSPRTKLGYAPYAMAVNSLAANGESANFDGNGKFVVSDEAEIVGNLLTSSITTTYTITASNVTLSGQVKAKGVALDGADYVCGNVDLSIHNCDTGIGADADNLTFHINNSISPKMTLTTEGRLGIGSAAGEPNTTLHVGTASQIQPDWQNITYATWFNNNSLDEFSSNAPNLPPGNPLILNDICALFEESIIVKKNIYGIASFTSSDQRMKTNLQQSNAKSDLALLNQIEITEYDHIDNIKKEKRRQKKVIAQQVEEVLPNAISKTRSVIPNVYEVANSFEFNEGELKINTNKAHEFEVGDKIDLKTLNQELSEVEVVGVIDAHTFTVLIEEKPENVFVYGKYVDDFRSVDYDAIAMLNVSASQEMYRMIMDLQAANDRLTEENKTLKSSSASIEDRLSMLEAMMVKSESNTISNTDTAGK